MLNKNVIITGLLGLITGAAIISMLTVPWIVTVLAIIYITVMLKMAEVKQIDDGKK